MNTKTGVLGLYMDVEFIL